MNLKIFTDGGSRGNPGNAGIGVVVYQVEDETDFNDIFNFKTKYEFSGFIGTATNNEAEYKALLKAIEWLSSNSEGVKSVDFYLDSKLVVEQINKNWKIKEERLKKFAVEIWTNVSKFNFDIKFIHVRREKNKEADKLVNQALDAHQP
ncbi:MAG: ribonuclease HI family protein [Pseudomonadales bacterium]|nr:ribonuclease HI family protein [Pseudomonadales bacterium]